MQKNIYRRKEYSIDAERPYETKQRIKMSLEEKYEFFHKPSTKKEIIGNREIVEATKYDLAEKVRKLEEDQAIILDQEDISQKLILERYEDSEDFLKHGQKTLVDASRPMHISREEKFNEYPDFTECSGITWKPAGSRLDTRSRMVHLVDCIEGVKIYNYASNHEGMAEIVHEAKPKNKGIFQGANYEIDLASRSDSYRSIVSVSLRHIPYTRKGNPSHVMSRIDASCDCQYNRFHNLVYKDDPTGRKDPLFIDMHSVAGYLLVVDKEQRQLDRFLRKRYKKGKRKACVAMINNPFPLPTQRTLEDYNKLERQVMAMDFDKDEDGFIRYRKDGEPKRKFRKLNRGEKEIFLHNHISTFGARTFYATKRLRDYRI